MKAGVCLQAWGERLPTHESAKKIFRYLEKNNLRLHLLQHVARIGWDLDHIKFWIPYLKSHNMQYILDVHEIKEFDANFLIQEFDKIYDYCTSIYPQGLFAVCATKELDWLWNKTFDELRQYIEQITDYLLAKVPQNVTVFNCENGGSKINRRNLISSFNDNLLVTHWFSGYDHTINGGKTVDLKQRQKATGHTRLWLTEIGVGINQTAQYDKMDVAYIKKILDDFPEVEYLGFWFAGGGGGSVYHSYFDDNGKPFDWFDKIINSGVLEGHSPAPPPEYISKAELRSILMTALKALED